MAVYYCVECGRLTHHVTVMQAAFTTQVTRATIYRWMGRYPLHMVVHASGRKYICGESLMSSLPLAADDAGAPRRSLGSNAV